MAAARRRVGHLWSILAGIVALLSCGISLAITKSNAASAVLWFVGCGVILVGGRYWVRARRRVTRRLLELRGAGPLDIERIEQTRVVVLGVPFGHEVDLFLRSGDRLPFGFWSEMECIQLVAALDINER